MWINRKEHVLGLPAEMLSPVDDIYIRKRGEFWRINIRGLDHVDMMSGLQDMGYNLPNWKLDTAAKEILKKPDLEKLTEVLQKPKKVIGTDSSSGALNLLQLGDIFKD